MVGIGTKERTSRAGVYYVRTSIWQAYRRPTMPHTIQIRRRCDAAPATPFGSVFTSFGSRLWSAPNSLDDMYSGWASWSVSLVLVKKPLQMGSERFNLLPVWCRHDLPIEIMAEDMRWVLKWINPKSGKDQKRFIHVHQNHQPLCWMDVHMAFSGHP